MRVGNVVLSETSLVVPVVAYVYEGIRKMSTFDMIGEYVE